MSVLYIMCGPSGCGKTTYIDNSEKLAHCVRVSRDTIRYSLLKDGEDYFSHEKEVFRIFVNTIVKMMNAGYDVVADATHLNEFSRRKLTQAIDMYTTDYKIIYVVFHVDANTCVERNKSRVGRANVPENIIRNMCRDFREPSKDEDERAIDIIEVGE